MGDLVVSNRFEVKSHKGNYTVDFLEGSEIQISEHILQNCHIIIDKRLTEIYKNKFKNILSLPSVMVIEAQEKNKSLEMMPIYVDHLIKNKIRRNHNILAIGGGIIQDIACFLAANILRGINWWFVPTTLLAQADSCIGSKSSINCGSSKNILGTFTPPERIFIHTDFLGTLDDQAMRSGIGEMLKVHAIDSESAFHCIAKDYDDIIQDRQLMSHYIRRSLAIKKIIIEQDEFDKDTRHVMNYGHTFGHAIESATDYIIPHGIAVTIGMDMANYIAMSSNLTTTNYYERMNDVLRKNYTEYINTPIALNKFFSAISKDKKNINNESVSLILPNIHGKINKCFFPYDNNFKLLCENYLTNGRVKTMAMT